MNQILEGVRVLDFSRFVAGPYCATLLGFLGAEVVRVERIGGGDDRDIAPIAEDGTGAVFLQTGCNKKSVSLKLGDPATRPIVDKLVRSADVVVTNFPPVVQQKMRLDYASLKAVKEDIILANVTAYGNTGPMANQGGFDGVAQAMSGAMLMTTDDDQPIKSAAPYADYSSAVMLAFGVMAALRERDQSGQGQEVSASLLGTALAVFASHLTEQSALGIDRVGTGNRVQTSGPSDVFATSDGHILVHCPGDGIFKRWTKLIGKPEWLDDPRFKNDQLRGDHRDELCEPMAQWCALRSTDEALAELNSCGIPAGTVLSQREALQHPQAQAIAAFADVSYPNAPNASVVDLPLNFSRSEAGITKRPPTVGEHTQELLRDIGLSEKEVSSLKQQGLVDF